MKSHFPNYGAIALAMIFMVSAQCATIQIEGSTAQIRGTLSEDDIEKLQASNIANLHFQNSPGGSYSAAKKYVNFVKEKRLNTIVSGRCFSSCAVAFLAGIHRRVDLSEPAILLFHLPSIHKDGEQVLGPSSQDALKMIDELTNYKLMGRPRDLLAQTWKDNQGLVFYFRKLILGKVELTLYCDGSQKTDLSKCEPLPGVDAVKLGILN